MIAKKKRKKKNVYLRINNIFLQISSNNVCVLVHSSSPPKNESVRLAAAGAVSHRRSSVNFSREFIWSFVPLFLRSFFCWCCWCCCCFCCLLLSFLLWIERKKIQSHGKRDDEPAVAHSAAAAVAARSHALLKSPRQDVEERGS